MKNKRKELAYFGRRLYEQGLTTSLGGNLSVRLPRGNFLVTASGKDKARLGPRDICEIRATGENATHGKKPSIETAIHLAIYRARPDVDAVVHAHPAIASAFSASKKPVNTSLTAEARVVLGIPAKAAYALSGSEELCAGVAEAAASSNVIILENHGVIALGETLLEAFHRVEVLEEASRMTLAGLMLGDARELDEKEVSALLSFFGR